MTDVSSCNPQSLAKVAGTQGVDRVAVIQAFYGYLQCRAGAGSTVFDLRNAYADAIAILEENGLIGVANDIQMALVVAGHVDE